MNIQGMILWFVVGMVGLVLFPIYSQASDTLYRQFVGRCQDATGTTTLVLTAPEAIDAVTTSHGAYAKGANFKLAKSGASCTTTVSAASGTFAAGTSLALVTEDGTSISLPVSAAGVGTLPSNWVWTAPAKVVTEFGTINQLLASILPLMLAVGFLSTGYLAGRRLSGGMNMMQAIGTEVLLLVVAIVAVFLTPTLIGFLSEASLVTDGSLSVTTKFGAIINLVLAVVPLIFVVAVMGITLKSGIGALRGGQMSSSMGM